MPNATICAAVLFGHLLFAAAALQAAEIRVRSLESRLAALEDEMDNMRSTLAVLLDRLERRFGPEGEKVSRP